jgi:hypothetical protein
MTAPSTFGPLYPALNASGVSIEVYAEDQVTLIPPAGAIVPYAKYYRDLLSRGQLRTSDPLELSGDPITIPPITRVSGGTVAVTSDDLPTYAANGEQVMSTAGYADILDGGDDAFLHDPADTTTTVDNIITFAAPSSGRFKRRNREPVVDLKKAGCVHGTTSDQASAIENAIAAALDLAAEASPNTTQRTAVIDVPPGCMYHLAAPPAIPGDNTFRVVFRSQPWRCVSSNAYGNASWASADPGAGGGGFTIAPGIIGFDLSSAIKWVDFENVVLMGVNGAGTRQGIYETGSSSVARLKNVLFANLTYGLQRGSVSAPVAEDLYFVGCETGMVLGGTDQYCINAKFQTCTLGLLIGGHNLYFGGNTMFQNCYDGLQIGNSVECARFDMIWFEANTNSDVTEYPGAVYHSVDIQGARWASYGLGGNEVPLTITQGRWNFGAAQRTGPKLAITGGQVSSHSADIHPSSVLTAGDFTFVGVGGPAGAVTPVAGAIDLNYLLTGPDAFYSPGVLLGNLTINAPTNMPYGKAISLVLKQDGTGGRTVSFSGYGLTGGYSNTGNVANAFTVLEIRREYPIGFLVTQSVPWSL